MRLARKNGFSLLEAIIAILLLVLAATFLGRHMVMMTKQTVRIQDKSLAAQKASQMMEELRALMATADTPMLLDSHDDGNSFKYVLTTQQGVTNPGDPLSGNGAKRLVRQINIISLPDTSTREVRVNVYTASTPHIRLAQIISILRSLPSNYDPTQVFDVYILAPENTLGVDTPGLDDIIGHAMADLTSRNPGLEIRPHKITRLAYGRDRFYTPFINARIAQNFPSPWVYLYPGVYEVDSQEDVMYAQEKFVSPIRNETTVFNGAEWPMADQFNHAMRYPDEVDAYNRAVAATPAGRAPPEISVRMLLEWLNNPTTKKLENAIIINLHGGTIPAPPMRNYSDAAKDPEDPAHLNWRVVTHPENLRYDAGTPVKLRVYAYSADPAGVPDDAVLITSTTLLIDQNISAGNITTEKMVGNSTTPYTWMSLIPGAFVLITHPTASETLITLFDTPLWHEANAGGQGLLPTRKLYGLEYIPCEIKDNGSANLFADALNTIGDQPKNTARWRITITGLTNGQHKIETRIGGNPGHHDASALLPNLSNTYVWVVDRPPVTELYQFIGDPRHMPYHDVKSANGYNWFFMPKAKLDAALYFDFAKAKGAFKDMLRDADPSDDPVLSNIDIPRYMQLYREGLLNSRALWEHVGASFASMIGLGGEIDLAFDDHDFQVIDSAWFPGGGTNTGYVTEVWADPETGSGSGSHVHTGTRLISTTTDDWFGRTWIGELYPDADFPVWKVYGNLPTTAGTTVPASISKYYRRAYQDCIPTEYTGTEDAPRTPQMYSKGPASLMNGNPGGDETHFFANVSQDEDTVSMSGVGHTMASDFRYVFAETADSINAFTPSTDDTMFRPDGWGDYIAGRTRLSLIEDYYTFSSGPNVSSLVGITRGGEAAYFAMNQLMPPESGATIESNYSPYQLAVLSLTTALRGYMRAGTTETALPRMPQLPRISINNPLLPQVYHNQSTITIGWLAPWRRWDDKPYTDLPSDMDPPGHSESTALVYEVKYSMDNGNTWFFARDNSPTYAGEFVASQTITTTSYNWDVSDATRFPTRGYLVRIEGYRQGIISHYAHHQRQIFIARD